MAEEGERWKLKVILANKKRKQARLKAQLDAVTAEIEALEKELKETGDR
jgi:hypothetical protein